MTLISIRLPEKVLNEADKHAKSLRVHRAEYICRAVEHLNKEAHSHHNHIVKRHLVKTSLRVKDERLPAIAEMSSEEVDLKVY